MREKQGQNTTGIVRRPKQSKQDRMLELPGHGGRSASGITRILPSQIQAERRKAWRGNLPSFELYRQRSCLPLGLIWQEGALGAVLSQAGGAVSTDAALGGTVAGGSDRELRPHSKLPSPPLSNLKFHLLRVSVFFPLRWDGYTR